jgi:hypothetical protein
MKRVFVLLVLAVLITGGAFAQTKTAIAPPPSSYLSGKISVTGAGVRYEWMLTDKLSLGVNAYYNSIFIWEDWDIGASVRFYPFGEGFFIGGNVGFHSHSDGFGIIPLIFIPIQRVVGVAISPEVGWRTDVGEPGGMFLSYGVKLPIVIGGKSSILDDITETKSEGIGVAFSVVPYLGIGFSF